MWCQVRVRADETVAVVKWYDNKAVTLISTSEGQHSVKNIKDGQRKRKGI